MFCYALRGSIAQNILRTQTPPTDSQLSMHVPPRSDDPLGDSIGPTVVTASPTPVCNLREFTHSYIFAVPL